MFNYWLTIEAEHDIIRIFELGLHKFGIAQAEKYYNKLFNCFDIIVKILCYFSKRTESTVIFIFVFAL